MFSLRTLSFILVALHMTPYSVNGAFFNLQRNVHDLGQKVTLASMIGGEEIIPKEVIRKIEEFIAPGLNISTNELCRNHSEVYIKGLRNGEAWAYQMLDSSAKLQSGLLTGNLIGMGNFDECIGVTDIETDFGQLSGKHCLATLKWENDTFMSTRELFKNVKRPGMPKSITVKWAFCIPSACGAEDVAAGLQNVLSEDINVTVYDSDCHTNVPKDFKTIDYVAIAIFSIFGFLAITSTAYDLLKKDQKKEILIAFSLYTNGKKLLSADTSKETIPCLHGIRFISICWIVLGHRYMVSIDGPAINLSFALDFIKGAKSTLVVNSQLGVDTFLVMSGFLVSYVFLKQTAKTNGKSFNIPLFYLHRYIRLTPVLAVMVLMQVSLIDHMGSGPLWDTSNQFLTQLCKENWWSALLYVQNYVSGDRMCVGHSWYLSVDMQLIWLSPLLLLPLLKWPKRWNLALLGTVILTGIATSFTINYVNQFPAGVRAGVGPKWDERDKYEYVKTHTRFTPWVIGFGLGYIVFLNKNKTLQFNKIQVATGWMLAALGFLGPVYCILPFQQPHYNYNAMESAFYSCLYRPIWALAVSWMIFACVTGYGGFVNTFLSWKAFQPFSRLTYCIYLVHFTFIVYRQFSMRAPGYLDDMNLVSLFWSDMSFSILLATALSLMFEAPATVIEKILLRRGVSKSSETQVPSNTQRKEVEEGSINKGFIIQINDNSTFKTSDMSIQ